MPSNMVKYLVLFFFVNQFIYVKSCCKGSRCGPNERYERNPSSICEPMYCSELGFPIDCSPECCDCQCDEKPACVCKEGYVRNGDDDCIPKSECPSCGGDPNAVAGCGVNCGRTCSTYGKDVSCIEPCYPNACDCRDGFLYDEVTKKCVELENCTNQPDDGSDSSVSCQDLNTTDIRARLDRGAIILSNEFIYQLVQSRPNKNFACSATSVLTPLAQITIFARNLVKEQLLTLQNVKDVDEIKCTYPGLIEDYNNQDKVEFEMANKYYVNYKFELSKTFQSVSQKYFSAEAQNVDFSQNVEAAKIMNDYVYNHTHGKIKDLVSSDALDANTIVVLINAMYFMGDWVHQFNPNDTQKRDFTRSDGTIVQVDTMYQENSFNYAQDDDLKIQALEMPYKNGNFTLLVILPQEGSFLNVVKALRNADVFIGILDKLIRQKVKVFLPKILIESSLDMGDMLKKANASEMFNPASDGFTGILKEDRPLYVSAAVQKIYFKSDETGSEAAAATAIIIKTRAAMRPSVIFNANRPILFYLLYHRTPLFCGAFVGA